MNRLPKQKTSKNHKEYEHRSQITQMLKVIFICEMPEHVKAIMRARIWGLNPEIFSPSTAFQIAYLNKGGMLYSNGIIPSDKEINDNGLKVPTAGEVAQIQEYERQGVFHCEQFLLSMHSQDIVDKFNKNFTKNKGQMFGKQPFEKKRFNA